MPKGYRPSSDFEHAFAAQMQLPVRSTSPSSQAFTNITCAGSEGEIPDSQELIRAVAGQNVTSPHMLPPCQVRTHGRAHRQLKRRRCTQARRNPPPDRCVEERHPCPAPRRAKRHPPSAPSRCPQTATPAPAGFTPAPRLKGLVLPPSITHTQAAVGQELCRSGSVQGQRHAPFGGQNSQIVRPIAFGAPRRFPWVLFTPGPAIGTGKAPPSGNPPLHACPPQGQRAWDATRGGADQGLVKSTCLWFGGCAARRLLCRPTLSPY